MFDTVLIANRGEIALRVMRACKELGLRTVAVYSEADRDAPHVAYADEAFLIGPAPAVQSYLNGDAIIAAARKAGAGAIHPGYGFLAENAPFATACAEAGIVFIGPPASAMQRMGGKVEARREASQVNVPIVPGTTEPVQSPDEVRELAAQFGYPIAIKAVGGGGGRGLRVVYNENEVEAAYDSAKREAASAFKNPEVYVEKYLDDPRHIEIQVLADTHGNVVHLGERDCSVQRRHQKLIEECPAPGLSDETRRAMGDCAVALTKSVDYVGAGTLEFLYQDGNFYFLEMNTRIQVEHTVTEMVMGIDLVQAQIRIAQGEVLWFGQADVKPRGHAIECRINAEDPANSFRPALGTIGAYSEPSGYGVRVDSGARANYAIPQYYDSMIAKLVTWGETRASAIGRMRRALADYHIDNVITTIPFHQLAMAHPAFAEAQPTVNFIPRYLADELSRIGKPIVEASPAEEDETPRTFDVEVGGRRFTVRVAERDAKGAIVKSGSKAAKRAPAGSKRASAAANSNSVASALQGTVVAVKVQAGQEVEAGQILFIVEAMKMENEITAPRAGVISEVLGQAGQVIEPGTVLANYQA
jgi:acetyl-CoA/propionyl-CoA carboxylase biotin carboxyl carrier protein